MSIPYLPPQDDSLDTQVEDLDSFELSDEQNMSDVYMCDGDAGTKIFRSNHSSSSHEPDSSCEPDTTTSPPSKIKPPDPSRQPIEKHTDYEIFCCHPKVVKFNSLFSLSHGCQVVCHIQLILVCMCMCRCVSTNSSPTASRLTQPSIPPWVGKMSTLWMMAIGGKCAFQIC